ncbi:hypothetical protein N9N00_05600 [Schleiferiaceae bacterium]|nr:hypothetical protein [Schleiferiaceae bacterium]
MQTDDATLLQILTSGCDERIFLRPETDANKYHLNPLKYEGLFHRGSCTCGTLTPSGHVTAREFMDAYSEDRYEGIVKDQTKRLQALLRETEEDQFHVFFGPSGSDMMYLPLLFQAMMHPGQEIINIVSCPEELGSGSKAAAENAYYAEWNQFGERIPMGEKVCEEVQSHVHFLDARASTGHIVDRKQAIRDLISKHPGQPLVGNLVFGSKSGIKDDLAIIDEFKEGVMWVVDMCQFRTDRTLIHDLIGKGVMIMVTGSKFYQAPPFCGALLVPKQWTHKMAPLPAAVAKGFERLFTAYDFPTALPAVREQLPHFKNVGLRVRWEIALREMEAYMAFSQDEANGLIRRWSQVVTGRLAQSDYFRLMPNIELTNDSIVSFMVLVNGRTLNNVELKKLFDYLVLNRHEGLRDYDRIFLGQPVQYGEKSFIRLAIGSYSVRKQLAKRQFDPTNDLQIITLIERAVKHIFE